jgi:hypothetical protein
MFQWVKGMKKELLLSLKLIEVNERYKGNSIIIFVPFSEVNLILPSS